MRNISARVRLLCAGAAASAMVFGAFTLPAVAAPASARLTAAQLADKALANLKSASSVHMTGTISDSGTKGTVNIWLTSRGCTGKVYEQGTGTVGLIIIGNSVWVEYKSSGWVAASGSDKKSLESDFGPLCYPAKLVHLLGYPVTSAFLSGTAKVGGVAAVQVTVPSIQTYLDISKAAKPEILRVGGTGQGGTFNLSGYGQRVTLTPPTS